MAPVEEPCQAARSRALGFLDDSALPGGGIGPRAGAERRTSFKTPSPQVVRGDGAVTWNVAAPDADEAPVPAVLGHVLKRGFTGEGGGGAVQRRAAKAHTPAGGRSLPGSGRRAFALAERRCGSAPFC